MSLVFEWIEKVPTWGWWTIVLASGIAFFGSLVVLHFALVGMAPDYFTRDKHAHSALREKRPFLWVGGLILKNVFGFLLLLVGIVMLATPGQGLLTILMGIALMNFPGKRRLEVALVRRPSIYKSINWIRGKEGKPPIEIPEASGPSNNQDTAEARPSASSRDS